jgi:tRNA modification GTPase
VNPDDTIMAVASAAGPGERAIIRISGLDARRIVSSVFDPAPKPGFLVPGSLRLTGVHSPLSADLYFWPGPRSYTGQDLAELHTISSPPLVERLIADLLHSGARTARPGEFTQRAFLSGKKDLTRSEAVLAVIEAGTDADLKPALAQLAGGVARPLDQLRDDLLNLLADVEAGLDFADEPLEFVNKSATLTRLSAGLAHLKNLHRQLDDRSVSGRAVRVVLAGPPNAGKSSLFNVLAGGENAIVSPTAGTTRDYLIARLDLGGVPVELIDTAGWQDAGTEIESQAQTLGGGQTARADLVLWCSESEFEDDARIPAASSLQVWTKADLGADPPHGSIPCSVIEANGTAKLVAAVTAAVAAAAKPPLAPSLSRCRHHVSAATTALRKAHEHALNDDPPELLALELRAALNQIGETAGAVYTPDLLDRIFSRFCIGK